MLPRSPAQDRHPLTQLRLYPSWHAATRMVLDRDHDHAHVLIAAHPDLTTAPAEAHALLTVELADRVIEDTEHKQTLLGHGPDPAALLALITLPPKTPQTHLRFRRLAAMTTALRRPVSLAHHGMDVVVDVAVGVWRLTPTALDAGIHHALAQLTHPESTAAS